MIDPLVQNKIHKYFDSENRESEYYDLNNLK